MMGVVSLNGRLLPLRQARVSVADGGFLYGHGVFETIRLYGGTPLFLSDHAARLGAAARLLDLEYPSEAALGREIARLARANRVRGDAVCRVSLSRPPEFRRVRPGAGTRPTRVIVLRKLPDDLEQARARGIAACSVSFERATGPAASIKSLSYLPSVLALQAAALSGANEAIFVSPEGEVLEGATTNVFALVGGTVMTPPVDGRIVPGVLRRRLLEIGGGHALPIKEAAFTREELKEAPEIFVTNAVREVLPVVRIDGCPVGGGRPGPVTRAVQVMWASALADLLAHRLPSRKRAHLG
jgi:D-alanine transaminase